MSKAFTKESDDDPGDAPAGHDWVPLAGEKNYLTPTGAAQLRERIEALRAEPRGDARRNLANDQRLAALLRRLEAAEVIDPLSQPAGRALFGATVTVRDDEGLERSYRIVGIDEADVARGWVSWRSPVARALLGLGVGETATLRTPGGEVELEVLRIEYHPG